MTPPPASSSHKTSLSRAAGEGREGVSPR
jgi:hypothetical protein